MILHAIDWLFARTFRSVWFGIVLLILVAGYIAIGSAFPVVREFFEKDELAFFRAWPLTALMVLLVVTLATVTIERIPFTPPRYGVWGVHIGIVLLVFGGFYHYRNKVEGHTVVLMGETKSIYFDRWERALYARVDNTLARVSLPDLPRFHAYDVREGDRYLNRASLQNLQPADTKAQKLGEILGVPDLKLDIAGYWPYANIRQRLREEKDGRPGFLLSITDESRREIQDRILIGGSEIYQQAALGPLAFAHRIAPDQASIDAAIAASERIHTLTIRAPGFAEQTIHVGVGQQIPLGDSGYIVQVDSFNPAWRTMDQQVVSLLTLAIKTPTQVFRRQLVAGRDAPTDWKLNVPGKGPMGERQSKPLDDQLITTYRFDDPLELLPRDGALYRYVFYTLPGSTDTTVVGVGLNERSNVQKLSGADARLRIIRNPRDPESAMMSAMSEHAPHAEIADLNVQRREHAVGVEPYVEEVPRKIRIDDIGKSGAKQVVMVRAKTRDWQKDVFVPFNDLLMSFRGGLLEVPGAKAPVQLQLGNTMRRLPADIRLDKFEAEAYGGLEAGANVAMRDFRSHITLINPTTRKETPAVVYLNNPVFHDNSNWIFFQSGWDPDQQRFTVLGVGNRPGTWVMGAGCLLIVVGIFYAFYIKPIIIKAMKENALKKVKIISPPPLTKEREAVEV